MRNVTSSLVSLSFSSALTGKQTVEVKQHLQRNTDPVHEQILSLIFDFFCFRIDCYDMAVTQLSPLLLSQAISSWNCFPERTACQRSLATMHIYQQHLVVIAQ